MSLETGIAALAAALCAATLWQTRRLRGEIRSGLPRRRSAAESVEGVEPTADLGYALIDSLDVEVCVLDAEARIVHSNPAWDARLSTALVSRSGARGSDFLEFCRLGGYYDPRDCERLARAVESILNGAAEPFRGDLAVEGHRRSRQVAVSVQPLPGSRPGALLTHRDRSDERQRELRLDEARREAETLADALETSRQSLKFAMRGAKLGLWHWDVTSGYFELTREWVAALGHTRSDLGADINAFRELLHPDDLVLWSEDDANSICGDEPYDRQFRLRRADGTYLWAQALGRSDSTRSDGAPETLSGVLIDIDARKSSELRDLGMAQIIEESVNEVYVFDQSTYRFVEVNRGARENVGYSLDELRSMTPWDIKPEYDDATFREFVAPLKSGETSRLEFETLHRRRDGTTYPVMVTLQAAALVGRPVFFAVILDVSQRNELEAKLRQAQRLESVGGLAAGVAHEINTPMQYVGNNIRFLSDCSTQLVEVIEAYEDALGGNAFEGRDDELASVAEVVRRTRFDRIREELPKAIEECQDGVDRVLKIVRAMKELTHPGGDGPWSADLNHVLQSSGSVTQHKWKYVAALEYDLDPELPEVACDASSVSQVFVNLIVNAVDAIADRGDGDRAPGKIVVRSRRDGEWVVAEVTDDGCGMPADVLERALDPFFTTKEVGRGTGQGLSLCHTIVCTKHGGEISIDSEEGVGTTIRVRLPIAQDPADPALDDDGAPRETAASSPSPETEATHA